MKTNIALLAALTLTALLFSDVAAAQARTPFMVYDNMFYRGKPNTTAAGLVVSNIIYENKIWANEQDYGRLPNRSAFVALVRARMENPGPLVIDIEKMPLKGPDKVIRHNAETLATLADWAHEAAPGKVIGFYGTNTLSKVPPSSLSYARELARHVDAFFPPVYTFDDDRQAYEKRAQETLAEARSLDPKKPVFFYLWPQYHDGTPQQFQFVDVSYWEFQLETALRFSNGIVLWSPSRYAWNDSTGWWAATREFLHATRSEL
jgi:hypothetical protein